MTKSKYVAARRQRKGVPPSAKQQTRLMHEHGGLLREGDWTVNVYATLRVARLGEHSPIRRTIRLSLLPCDARHRDGGMGAGR